MIKIGLFVLFLGVYVPGKSRPVGVYVPKNAPKMPKPTSYPKNNILTPTRRYKRKIQKPQIKPRKTQFRFQPPIFAVNLEADSPLGKLYDLGQSKTKQMAHTLSRIRLKKPKPPPQRFYFWPFLILKGVQNRTKSAAKGAQFTFGLIFSAAAFILNAFFSQYI